MKHEDVIRMAREAAQGSHRMELVTCFGLQGADELERFAVLVAAAEREACAKVCDEHRQMSTNIDSFDWSDSCAESIRSRSQS